MLVYVLFFVANLKYVQRGGAVLLIHPDCKQKIFNALNYYRYDTVKDKIFYYL